MSVDAVREGYQRFADIEARGVSEVYYDWAHGVASDDLLPERIAGLPRPKWQPNLFFAAARHAGAPEGTFAELKEWVLQNWDATVRNMLTRSTQTNEAARCAVLLPALTRLEGPLSLIEVGASAGLCLYPDHYSYAYSRRGQITELHPPGGRSPVVIPCEVGEGAIPTRVPQVAWRAGLDLNPLDVTNPDELGWLESLVWPEHAERRERLRLAAQIVAQDPPVLVRASLMDGLESLISQAPADTHVVVFHSAVLVYVDQAEREAFAQKMVDHGDVTWVSNEGAGVFPSITAQVTKPIDGRHVLAVNGVPASLSGPHGQTYEELSPRPQPSKAPYRGAQSPRCPGP